MADFALALALTVTAFMTLLDVALDTFMDLPIAKWMLQLSQAKLLQVARFLQTLDEKNSWTRKLGPIHTTDQLQIDENDMDHGEYQVTHVMNWHFNSRELAKITNCRI
jgi:hypothetical protein